VKHGTYSAYYYGKCRCDDCVLAYRRWYKRWRWERDNGQPRYVPRGPVAEHVRSLIAAGWYVNQIAERANVARSVVRGAMGERGNKLIHRRNAAKLLAVKADMPRVNRDAQVPSHGAILRIKALQAIGWRHADLTERSGLNTALLYKQTGKRITQRHHDAIVRVYDDLAMTPGPSHHTAARAAKKGWLPPLALDDDRLDDPTYVPDVTVLRRPDAPKVIPVEDVAELHAQGLDQYQIGERLGWHHDTVRKAIRRMGRAS